MRAHTAGSVTNRLFERVPAALETRGARLGERGLLLLRTRLLLLLRLLFSGGILPP
jgi:hypothetical protein